MEIERYDHGSVLYAALGGGEWSRSEFPHERVTLDFDSQDRLIGVEMLAIPGTCSGTKNPNKSLAQG